MGGYSYCIPVIPSLERLAVKPCKSFLSRIFGSKPVEPSPLDDYLHDVSDRKLAPIIFKDMKQFLNARIETPWAATKELYDYLFGLKHSVYIRGQRNKVDEPFRYSVQLAFSGCAGMAEVSSLVAWHWADIYFKANRSRIYELIFARFGLDPCENQPLSESTDDECHFLPTPEFRYAQFTTNEYKASLENQGRWDEEFKRFDIDAQGWDVPETEGVEEFVDLLENHAVELMSDNLCRCQLCVPEFDVDSFYASLPK